MTLQIAANLLQLISSDQAYYYRVVPEAYTNGVLCLYSDITDDAKKQELSIIMGITVMLKKVSTEEINRLLSTNYRKQKDRVQAEELSFSNDFLQKILITAKEINSSDIHFEPFEFKCRVRFRLDGKLKEQYIIPKEEYPVIVNKIKIQAGLDISEKRLPQDGRITVKHNNDEFDIRVSSLPTLRGEKIVLRILGKDNNNVQLEDLGFEPTELHLYKESIRRPNGIVLISGPTGSGKTTTLYATLKLLNNQDTNILTIEDPIEYTLEGVNQVQLRENIGLDFSSTLRTFLRQDPDVIMVGEIRDVKTANMAIRAALTGHLVLSTIHTNSAWATVSRLIDMGIPPFLIASTLNVSVAQRLVRKLCPDCKEQQPVTKDIFPDHFHIPKGMTRHWKATGCPNCYYTGYNGRKAVYEILPVTKHLVPHIKNNELEIDHFLAEHHLPTLKDNAIQLITDGVTSVEEVYALLTN